MLTWLEELSGQSIRIPMPARDHKECPSVNHQRKQQMITREEKRNRVGNAPILWAESSSPEAVNASLSDHSNSDGHSEAVEP